MAKDFPPRHALLFTQQELDQQRPVILRGVQQYNEGYFFEAHETLEDVWYRCPLPARTFLQGLIQVAAAFVHLARHEYPGTVRLLGHALDKLEQFPSEYLGFQAGELTSGLKRARGELLALGPGGFEAWDRAGIPQIRLARTARRRRS